jgi:hypothetical protein
MKLFNVLTLFVIAFLSTSCNPPTTTVRTDVLVMNISSFDCSLNDQFLTFENDTVRIVYIFWAERGRLNIYIHNKLSKPLYIDWKKCSYITGSTKHDYWQETTTLVTNTSSSSFANEYSITDFLFKQYNSKSKGSSNVSSNGFSISSGTSITRLQKPERITFIPPGTTIAVGIFTLYENDNINIPANRFISKDTTVIARNQVIKVTRRYKLRPDRTFQDDSLVNGPTKVRLSYINYDLENSPFSFRSFITYSTDEKFAAEAYANNSFYLSRITQMPVSTFELKASIDSTIRDDRIMWADSKSFYVFRNVEISN